MEQRQEHPREQPTQPLHVDRHRIPVNITLLFAVAVAVWALFVHVYPLAIAGLGVAVFSWLTSPRQFLIYQDALVITYGRPRVKVIYFTQIAHLEMLNLRVPDRLRVRLRSGRREVLMTRNPDTFRDRLQSALDEFRRTHPESVPPEQGPRDQPLK